MSVLKALDNQGLFLWLIFLRCYDGFHARARGIQTDSTFIGFIIWWLKIQFATFRKLHCAIFVCVQIEFESTSTFKKELAIFFKDFIVRPNLSTFKQFFS